VGTTGVDAVFLARFFPPLKLSLLLTLFRVLLLDVHVKVLVRVLFRSIVGKKEGATVGGGVHQNVG
jgi:hypothetical protein